MTAEPVILDCDTGIDDALTILYLAGRADADLVAVGSVHGNVPTDVAARNTLRVLEVAGLTDVPVAVGAARPLAQELQTAEYVHGADGLGDTAQPAPARSPEAVSAAEQLVTLARSRPGELSLLAIGPLTNVAIALLIEPDLPTLLKRVVVMGGAFGAPGNVTALAEANVWHDPEAADLVFSAGWPLTAVGLDVTMSTVLRGDDLARIGRATGARARFAWQVVQFYLDFYQGQYGERGCPVHDALAAALLLEPGLGRSEEVPVTVELHGGRTRGATLVDRRRPGSAEESPDLSRPPVSVVHTVDAPAALAGLLEALGA